MENKVLIAYSACASILLVGLALRSSSARTKKYAPVDIAPLAGDKALVLRYITVHDNFPKKNVTFRDIFPVLRQPAAFEALMRLLTERVKALGKIDVVVGLESRGFLFGPLLALILNCSFTPVRKPGKLPGKIVAVSYEKEYGKDTFEIQSDAIVAGNRVLIVDDLLATGGSLFAAVQLVQGMKAEVVECLVVIELLALGGRPVIPANVWSLFQF